MCFNASWRALCVTSAGVAIESEQIPALNLANDARTFNGQNRPVRRFPRTPSNPPSPRRRALGGPTRRQAAIRGPVRDLSQVVSAILARPIGLQSSRVVKNHPTPVASDTTPECDPSWPANRRVTPRAKLQQVTPPARRQPSPHDPAHFDPPFRTSICSMMSILANDDLDRPTLLA